MTKVIAVGAGVQDVFLSQSDALRPVCESPERCFAKLELGAKADVNQIHFSTGGGATNAAVTFARQGHEAASPSPITSTTVSSGRCSLIPVAKARERPWVE